MKIAIMIDQLVSGGVQKAAIEEAQELIKLGHAVTLVILIRLKYNYQYTDITAGLKIIYLSDLNPRLFRRAIRVPFFSFLTFLHLLSPYFVKRYSVISGFDFLISHGTTTCITAAAISRHYRIPYLAFIWDPLSFILETIYGKHLYLKYLLPILKPVVKKYETDFILSAALVATASKVHQKYIHTHYQVKPLVIYPGIEIPKKISAKSGSNVLGYSRWQLAKNPHFFLRLAQKFPDLTFLIAGEWPDKREEHIFKSEILILKLENQVKLLPYITNKDLQHIARQSFVWLHPHFEAFGMSGLEMAAHGLPLIIPKGSGISELFTHNKEGYFPSVVEVEEIGKLIEFLHNHPIISNRMGKKASVVARNFTWKHHAWLLNQEIVTYLTQTKIVVTMNAFVTTQATGGGDRFFIELARRVPQKVYLTIIVPFVGLTHLERAQIDGSNIRFIILTPTLFDNKEGAIAIFITYLIRALQTILILPKLSPFSRLHTSTDLIADTIPAYIYQKTHKDISWIARFFHFYSTPLKRRGNIVQNTGSYLLQRLSLLLFKKADIVLVDNPLLVNALTKLLPKTSIQVSTGGVDVAEIQNTKSNSKLASTAIFVGRLSAHKGVYDTLLVWREVHKQFPKARLLLLGYCPPREMTKIQNKVKELHLSSAINFPGFVHDRHILYEYLRSSKILLFLDHEAGFGLVVVEAMAAGLPVIAYNLPIFGTVYHQGFINASIGDVTGVSAKVIKLLKNKSEYSMLSYKAQVQAKEFSWEKTSRKFYRVLTKYADET